MQEKKTIDIFGFEVHNLDELISAISSHSTEEIAGLIESNNFIAWMNRLGFEKEKILGLIKDLYDNKTEEIYISGGEPLLYPYIDDAILYANSLGINVTLATNALEISKHLEIIKKGVQLVSISLDGIGETHDKFRGKPGAFNNCVKMFKLLKKNNIKTRISAMIWKENVEQLEEMISLAKSCGVSKVNLAFLIPEGRAKTEDTIKLPIERYKEIVEEIAELRKKYKSEDFDIEIRRNNLLDENSLDCPGGRNLIHINVNGKVSPCSWIAKLDKDDEFSAYWPEHSIKECIDKFNNFEKVVKFRKEKYGYCGCIALSKIYSGNFIDKDPLNNFLEM